MKKGGKQTAIRVFEEVPFDTISRCIYLAKKTQKKKEEREKRVVCMYIYTYVFTLYLYLRMLEHPNCIKFFVSKRYLFFPPFGFEKGKILSIFKNCGYG